MRADIALFFTTLMAIAIVGLIVRNGDNASKVIHESTVGLSSIYGTVISGNPAFYERRG